MADMETALRARWLGDDGVSAIVGDEVHWGILPQGTPRPAVRLQVVSDPRPLHLKGFQGLRATRVQADCLAEDYATARALAEAVIAAAAEPATQGAIVFSHAGVEGPRDLGEQTETGFVHRLSVDLIIWWREI